MTVHHGARLTSPPCALAVLASQNGVLLVPNSADDSKGESARTGFDFLIWDLARVGGMERALIQLASAMSKHHDVRVLVAKIGGPGRDAFTSAGLDDRLFTGRRRLFAAWRGTRPARVTVVVGIWTLARLRLMKGPGSQAIHWEHSCTRERLQTDHRLRWLYIWVRPLIRNLQVVVPSAACRAGIVTVGARSSAVSIVPNPWNEPPGTQERSGESPRNRLGVIARLVPIKRVDLAVSALIHLPESYELMVYGDGPALPDLVALATRLGLVQRVHFGGWIDDPAEALGNIDVLLSTSVSETFGFSLLEAASANVPVIATAGGATAEMVETLSPGVLVEHPTPEAMAAAVVHLAAHPIEPVRWAQAKQNRIELAPDSVRKRWEELSGSSPPR